MTLNYKKLKLLLIAFFLTSIFTAITIVTNILPENLQYIYEFFYGGAPLLLVITSIWTLRSVETKTHHTQYLLPMTIAYILLFIGEIIWLYLEYLLKIEPFPSIADILFLASYVPLALAYIVAIKFAKVTITQSRLIAFVVISIVLTFITIRWGIYAAYDPNATMNSNIISISYAFGDLIIMFGALAAILLVAEYKGGSLSNMWLAFAVGLSVTWGADILFAIFNTIYNDNLYLSYIMDSLWIAGYLCYTWGMLIAAESIKKIRDKYLKKAKIGISKTANTQNINVQLQ